MLCICAEGGERSSALVPAGGGAGSNIGSVCAVRTHVCKTLPVCADGGVLCSGCELVVWVWTQFHAHAFAGPACKHLQLCMPCAALLIVTQPSPADCSRLCLRTMPCVHHVGNQEMAADVACSCWLCWEEEAIDIVMLCMHSPSCVHAATCRVGCMLCCCTGHVFSVVWRCRALLRWLVLVRC